MIFIIPAFMSFFGQMGNASFSYELVVFGVIFTLFLYYLLGVIFVLIINKLFISSDIKIKKKYFRSILILLLVIITAFCTIFPRLDL